MKWLLVLVNLICFGTSLELSDIDDSLALLWKPQDDKKTNECKVQIKGSTKYGFCMPHAKCIMTGGSPQGFCGFLSTCCIVENSCGQISGAKISYFEAHDLPNGITNCNYNIRLRNPNICQVRLDFIKFHLAPATLTLPQHATNKIYKCLDDRLTISPNVFDIPILCGNNDKQHVYVHVNQTDNVTKGVLLQMTLSDRNYHSHLFAPSWKIKITQLECPADRKFFSLPSQDVNQDFPQLAPLGAIQYFNERAGYIKSFGYDGSVSIQSYTYDQKYAIAFKRDIGTCGISFTPQYIYLPYTSGTGIIADKDCTHYLFVPDLYFDVDPLKPNPNDMVAKVCLKENLTFRSYAPGPLYIYFSSVATDFATEEDKRQGFNIKYELLNKCI
ncbi:unnamed protein product [Callosobruchus maculatus]|uniref:CUB domain-containing protein n=2 Tax=Callosobruchus maculatus TaxID=64391 RepID=A0A653BUQ6_CALMS|nr:unnamed protein product [Callosobruchus maculatus]